MPNYKDQLEKFLRNRVLRIKTYPEAKGWPYSEITDGVVFDSHRVSISTGNIIQAVLRYMCSLRYGMDNCPEYVEGWKVSKDEAKEYWSFLPAKKKKKGHTALITRLCPRKAQVFATERFLWIGKEEKVTLEWMKTIRREFRNETQPLSGFNHVSLDYSWCRDGKHLMLEGKSGGSLDGQKAEIMITKSIIMPFLLMDDDAETRYCALNTSEGISNKGRMKNNLGSKLSPELVMIGNDFWKEIGIEGVSLDDFKHMFSKAMNELKDRSGFIRHERTVSPVCMEPKVPELPIKQEVSEVPVLWE